MQSNIALNPIADVVRYVFPSDTFNGSMEEEATDGSPVGAIQWGRLFKPMVVTLHGKEIPGKQVLSTRRSGIFSAPKQFWVDAYGSEFYWKRGSCYDYQNRVIAHYTPTVAHVFHTNEPATLSVDSQFIPVLDKLLVTALMIEHQRRQQQRAGQASAASASASASAAAAAVAAGGR
ncbi:hypothetical protein FRB95_013292 [Tulasnella sp. JGI-2019a]|nr:hypothetical protein FRB93_000978 [Tulasnella sp. JGI-2019a]KAG9034384.1 hypothetical protein FRB95_013292 [Tulasnella sp. JGI-2019a]